ncbi:MAG: hypothetical protein Q9166_005514 [cf. Caloplaca sp. 2 TL-2023]
MADQLSISLKAWPSYDKVTESLPYLIARINEQRGSFRNITEASLEEEIRAAEAGEQRDSPDDEGDLVEEGLDAQAKGDELSRAREEIIKKVGEAYNTSSQTLDLVSLLLTSHASKIAETTVSPFVKQVVPYGSLGVEMMQESQRSETEADGLVGLGWRMHSLTRSADSLLASATRLEQEIERENTYWGQVLAVRDAGWPLCRIPAERQTLGVRFGCAEGHADYHDRGLAALRRDVDGNVKLDRGQRWQGDKRLRVRVLKDDKTWTEESPSQNHEDPTLTQQLLRARNSLFDEELHHELNREARNLVSHGVRSIDGKVRFPYDDGSQIEVSLADQEEEQATEVSIAHTVTPAAIATTLRILLSHAHHQNLQRRSQPPPPVTDTSIVRPFYSLLRPVLEVVQHQAASKAAKAISRHLTSALSAANLPFTVAEPSSSLEVSRAFDSPSKPTQCLVNRLIGSHHSAMTMHLPSDRTTLRLDIHTSIFPPTFGTAFKLTTISSAMDTAIADMPQTLHFPTIEKLRAHLWNVTCLDVVTAMRANPAIDGVWTQPSRYQSQLVRKHTSRQRDRLCVEINEEGLKVDWIVDGKSASRVWSASSSGLEEGALGLVDVINQHMSLSRE